MIPPRVGIIIVNWNNAPDTINCLSSLDSSSYQNFVRILVDNGSSDGSVDKIMSYRSTAFQDTGVKGASRRMELVNDPDGYVVEEVGIDFLIKNPTNDGYTGGNNIGIFFCIKKIHPDYILLLNNDTIVHKNMLQELVRCMDSSDHVIIQPKILFERNREKINSTGNFLDLIGNAYCRGMNEVDRGQYDIMRNDGFFYASGAAMMIRASQMSKLTPREDQFFDPLLFAYHEDADVGWIARTRGLSIAYCPESICYHKGRTTTNTFSVNRIRLIQRNNLRVLLKNHNRPWIFAAVPASILFNLVITLFLSLAKNNSSLIIHYIKGVIWNMENIRSTLSLRKWVQEGRSSNDTVVFQRISLVVHSIARSEFGDKNV